jgi:tRNA A37 methylthiotransferase MiaB
VIVGFPGETKADVAELERFLSAARLDAIGVFGYSDEDGTEAATLPHKVRRDTVKRRYEKLSALADRLVSERAEERIGEIVEVLIESTDDGITEGRAAHQAPEVDGTTTVFAERALQVGELVRARVVASIGVDLEAELVDDRAAVPHLVAAGPGA